MQVTTYKIFKELPYCLVDCNCSLSGRYYRYFVIRVPYDWGSGPFGTVVTVYQSICYRSPKDTDLHDEFSENLKSRIFKQQAVHPVLVLRLSCIPEKVGVN
jgi:hypothetical protein